MGRKDTKPRKTGRWEPAEPLEVILARMDIHYARYRDLVEQNGLKWNEKETLEELRLAADEANRAAPYCHPKLNAIAVKNSSVDALTALLQEIDGASRGLPSRQPLLEVIRDGDE